MLNGLDLFSGIGGITVALSPWVKPVAYCEYDRYAQAVLLSQMSRGQLPIAPIWDDVRTLQSCSLPEIDILYGGFPCQDVSTAGARKGLDGERTGLFREAIRLIRECKPKFVFFENVGGIRQYVFTVRGELEALGYDCRDGFLSAAEVGANHNRNRWWLLAHATGKRIRREKRNVCETDGGQIGEMLQQLDGSSAIDDVGNSKYNGSPSTEKSRSNGAAICHNSERQNKAIESERTGSPRDVSNSDCAKRSRLSIRKKTKVPKSGSCGSDGEICNATGERLQDRRSSQMGEPEAVAEFERSGCQISNSFSEWQAEWRHGQLPTTEELKGAGSYHGGRTPLDVGREWWTTEPDVGRVANGIPFRVDRIKGLGNAVVPLQAREAFKILMGIQ